MEDTLNNGKKILWIEDDPLLNDLVGIKSIHSNYNLTVAKDGLAALAKMAEEVPDLVVLDLVLPGISGFEVLEKMKADERLKNVPVIVFSNLSQVSDYDKAMQMGATKYFVKATLTLSEILKKIESII